MDHHKCLAMHAEEDGFDNIFQYTVSGMVSHSESCALSWIK